MQVCAAEVTVPDKRCWAVADAPVRTGERPNADLEHPLAFQMEDGTRGFTPRILGTPLL